MTEAMPSKEADAVGQLFEAALIREGELWMNTHKELLANVAAMMESWLQFHRAALDASSRALHRLYAHGSLAELLDLQREWVSDFWGWPAAGAEDGVLLARKAAIRSREPIEAGHADILVRRQPAKGAAEAATAAE